MLFLIRHEENLSDNTVRRARVGLSLTV